ncbi:MAG TPA: hypothetical protein PK357_01565 [Candidatus Pacearchaeota archaeon]|nr:hypothetical protein [Candidatus Pacearchaeota archaeon]
MKKGLEPKLIPYEHTLYDLLIENFKGKYFQNMMAPHLLFQIPEENSLGIHYVEDGKLSVWFPLLKRHGNLSLNEFHEYALISEEQFKDYQKNLGDVFEYLLVHKDSPAFKEYQTKNNKANLSARQFSTEDEQFLKKATNPKILKQIVKITKEILSKPPKSF